MFLPLFCILWGSILTLLLCAPYSYYPLFFSMLGVSIIIFIIAKKYFKGLTKRIYAISVILFFASYTLCSYLIFKPADFHFSDITNLSKDKKAVIFYCDGEMEKYTPYYSSYFFEDSPLILKPLHSMKIKNIYRKLDVNAKNKDLINVATEVKNSLLNNGPYYFYIAFSSYVPDIKDSIHSALSDGCSEITIINYSSLENFEQDLKNKIDIHSLEETGVNIKVTKPVYFMNSIPEIFTSRVINMPLKWDALLLIDSENPTSINIKSSLMQNGYKDSQILITKDIPKAMEDLKANNSTNLLYINLEESGSGLKAEVLTPKIFEEYSADFKISGIKSWGYDKRFSKAAIEAFLEAQKDK